MNTPQTVVFTRRAFNAIITETISKHPIETGGVFLGYVLDNGTWIVVENVAPGMKSTHQRAYFEYDTEFVTYLANVIANQYKKNLRILGLWHRHPGSMDVFSDTDMTTNRDYAIDNSFGAISALVNCDPKWRMTMYHISQDGQCNEAEWFVDDGEIIPEEYLELHYTDVDQVPTFDAHGVVRAQQTHSETAELSDSESTEPDTGQVSNEPLECPSGINYRPYTFEMALKDMKKIVKQLIDGKEYGNFENV